MKTKLTLLSFLCALIVFGAAIYGYQDFQTRGAPGNPASGFMRIWADTGTSTFKCLTSGGGACTFAGANSGTVSSVATTSPITGGTITSTGTIACATCTVTVASGTSALGTSAISSAACATVVTTTATGTAATDAIISSPNGSIKAITGYVPATTGGLTITGYPTMNAVNWDVCNWSTGSIIPGALTLNWRVVR